MHGLAVRGPVMLLVFLDCILYGHRLVPDLIAEWVEYRTRAAHNGHA